MEKPEVLHHQNPKEKQEVIDGALATLVPREELAIQEKEKAKDLLGKLSKSQDLQKLLSKILEATGGLGYDWANSLIREVLIKFGLLDKAENTLYWTTWIWLRFLCRTAWNCKIYGEMFPEYGSGVVVGNHVSHADPFFIGQSVHRKIIWMSKEENFQTPIVRSIFRNYGAFPVKRGAHDEEAWTKGKEIIARGDWLGMFPEGTRSFDGTLGDFHTGAIRMAIEARVPLVPIVTAGLEKVLPKGGLFFKIGTPVSMLVGKPITYEEYYDSELTYARLQELTQKLKDVMTAMLDELHDIHGLRDGTTLHDTEKELSIGYPRAKE